MVHVVLHTHVCRDGTGKKWPLHIKSYGQDSALDVVISFYEPYHLFAGATYMSNKTDSMDKMHSQTTYTSQHNGVTE